MTGPPAANARFPAPSSAPTRSWPPGRCWSRSGGSTTAFSARTVLFRPAMETPATEPVVQALIGAAGPGTAVALMSYWADSAFLAAAGVPTVLYGPEGEGAHADTEWVSRAGTGTAAAVLTRLAQDFCA